MFKNSTKWLAALGCATIAAATAVHAQDSGALLDALVKKGILNDQEAEEIRADLTNDFHSSPWGVAGGKSTTSLKIEGRLQTQFDGLSTNTDGAGASAASVNHFFLRRIYFGATADIGADWKAVLNYNFADLSFDKAYAELNTDLFGQDLALDVGLRKVNFGMEEYTSSGSLKAIERSAVTRYFVESNNGRRLGAGSYHVGIFADFNNNARKGKESGLFYSAAITNPERAEASGTVNLTGNKGNNNLAYWADLGYFGKTERFTYKVGAAVGILPDQGRALGAKDDISEMSLYTVLDFGRFELSAEYLNALVEGAGADNNVNGYWIQPAFMVTDKLELVARYSFVDSDGRGVRVSDGIRNAPTVGGAATGTKLTEYYVGFNYYFSGKDVRLAFGYVGGETDGALRDESVSGLRSQLQLNF